MLSQEIIVKIAEDIDPFLIDFCLEKNFSNFLLICDSNTYIACGIKIEQALKNHGLVVRVINLGDNEIIANEEQLIQVMIHIDQDTDILLAIGSGTITDITRFVSHRVRLPFISIPTAPSVDGFVSIGSPLVIHRLKRTILCKPPIALFGDLRVLCNAPRKMIAAGFGDLIGKYLSIADWKLGNIIRDEPFDDDIYQRLYRSVKGCVESIPEIRNLTKEGIKLLMESLIESGFCMLDFGNTSPASGAEHHISHFWEMKLLEENRPAVLHGAKVGVASIITAGWYEKINKITNRQITELISKTGLPDPDITKEKIRLVFGLNSEEILKEQSWFLQMRPSDFQRIKQRITQKWGEIVDIASRVPAPLQLSKWLNELEAPTHANELGLNDAEIKQALEYSHFLRDRFTINKFRKIFGNNIF
jgi:glycerol-1-phosphate dehydrogenase [NAD(P)+]